MVRGLIINEDGTFDFFVFNSINTYLETNDNRDVMLIEEYDREDRTYEIYGSMYGDVYNDFELNTCNPMGIIYVVCRNLFVRGEYQDIDSQLFLRDYCQVDNLDDYIFNDELGFDCGEYEEDGWMIGDDEIE